MAILNVTPDSFSDGGRFSTPQAAVDAALRMMDEGADLIDVGGESTRPGAEPVSAEEEVARTVPIVDALSKRNIPVSIDTMKPSVAKCALDAGALLINDVNGLRSPGMMELVAERKVSVCIMHMQGEPRTMQLEPTYQDVVQDVRGFLVQRADDIKALGVPANSVYIDPGIGFGKSVEHNLTLLQHLRELVGTGYPVLLGVSRKSFIGKVLGGLPVEDRLEGTLALQVHAQLSGVRVIRAHDVKASRRAIDMIAAIA